MAGAGRQWAWASGIAVAAAAAAGVSVWALGGGSSPGAPAVRARVYSSYQACLLTGGSGITSGPAAQAWAGMEDASAQTRAKVSYLAVSGPATAGNAGTFLGSLLVRKCGVIVAAGSAEQAAVLTEAPKFPAVRFVLAGDKAAGPVAGTNVTVASPGQPGQPGQSGRSGLRDSVAAIVESDAGSRRGA